MPLSLDEVLAAPQDPELLQRHLQTLGLVQPPALPAVSPTVAKMVPPTPATLPPLERPKIHETVNVESTPTAAMEATSGAGLGGTLTPPATKALPQPLNPANLLAREPAAAAATPVAGGIQPQAALPPLERPNLLASPRERLESFRSREQDPENISRIAPVGEGEKILQPGTSEYTANELARAADERRHPWGSEENHPGVIGKIGHVLGRIGNIAGDIVAPGTMALIPGTDLNKQFREGRLEARMEKERAGETAAAREKTEEQREKSEEGLREAEIKNYESEIAARGIKTQQLEKDGEGNVVGWKDDKGILHSLEEETTPQAIRDIAKATKSKAAKTAFEEWQKQNPNAPVADWLKLEAENKTPAEEEKAIADYLKGHGMEDSAANRDKAREALKTRDRVPRAPTEREEWLKDHPGKNIEDYWREKARTAQQVKMEFPTTQMRNVDAQAQVAVEGIPGVLTELDNLRDQFGPVKGRWNEFMQGKVGAPNPEFAGLRADLLMLSSAVALAHARGRLPENLREEFDRTINAPEQNADNLISVINHIQPWMVRMTQMGVTPAAGPGATPAAPTAPTAAAKPAAAQPEENSTRVNRRTGEVQTWKNGKWQTTTPGKQEQARQ